jgi:Chaperone of endosialidase
MRHVKVFLALAMTLAVAPEFAHGGTTKETVVNDDMIIQGHVDVGAYGVTGEVFGNDTLRMEDIIIRLHFDDASTPGTYPDNDWRIVINDDFNHGADYFAIEDSTGGTTPFKVMAGAPDNALHVASTGSVGVGTSTPGWPLTVNTTGQAATLVLNRTDGALGYINAGHTYVNIGTGTQNHLRFTVNGNWRTQINTDGSLHMASGASCTTGGVWTNSSSRELKDNIESLTADEAMDTLALLDPVKYTYKADHSDGHVGFIAEDVPGLVATKDRKGMSPMDVTAVLTKVVQEQQRVISGQQKKMEALQARIEALEYKVRP